MTTHAKLELHGAMHAGFDEVLTPDALEFVAELAAPVRRPPRGAARGARPRGARACAARGDARLPARHARDPRGRLDRRARPATTCSSAGSRSPGRPTARWSINALNSGADGFMADFEDANAPDLAQHGRRATATSATRSTARSPTATPRASDYELGENPATLLVRPRGWHLPERHLLVDAEPVGGRPVRLRPVRVPLRAAAAAQRHRAVLLSAEDGVASRGAAVERRVRASPRSASGSRAGRSRRRC